MINNSNGTRGGFRKAGGFRSAPALCHCLRGGRGPFIPIRTARRLPSLLPVVPRGTAGSAAAQCSGGAVAGCYGRVAGSQPGFRHRPRDALGREFFARSSRLVPYPKLPVRRRDSVSDHVFYGTRKKEKRFRHGGPFVALSSPSISDSLCSWDHPCAWNMPVSGGLRRGG